MNYILIILADILLSFEFAFSKKYQSIETNSLAAGLRFNTVSGLFTAIIFFALSGFKLDFSAFSVLFALAMSLCAATYSILGFSVLKKGNMAIYSVFLMSGGMILPYIFGILFLNEPLTPLRIIGIIIILFAIILSNKAKGRLKISFLLLCMVIFLLNGCVSVFSKVHQFNPAGESVTSDPVIQVPTTWADMTVNAEVFVMISGFVKFICCTVALLVILGKNKADFKALPVGKVLPVIALSAVASGTSYLFQLLGAAKLNGTILYPLVTGGCIVFTALGGWLVYKEKPTKPLVVGMILCVVGTLFFLRF